MVVALVSFFWTPYPPNDQRCRIVWRPPAHPGSCSAPTSWARRRDGADARRPQLAVRQRCVDGTALLLGSVLGLSSPARAAPLARDPHQNRRRRPGAAGHPRRPRGGHQARARQHDGDPRHHRVVRARRRPCHDRSGASGPRPRLRRGCVRLRSQQALRAVQARAPEHRPAADRPRVGDVRARRSSSRRRWRSSVSASSHRRRRGVASSTRPSRCSTPRRR